MIASGVDRQRLCRDRRTKAPRAWSRSRTRDSGPILEATEGVEVSGLKDGLPGQMFSESLPTRRVENRHAALLCAQGGTSQKVPTQGGSPCHFVISLGPFRRFCSYSCLHSSFGLVICYLASRVHLPQAASCKPLCHLGSFAQCLCFSPQLPRIYIIWGVGFLCFLMCWGETWSLGVGKLVLSEGAALSITLPWAY